MNKRYLMIAAFVFMLICMAVPSANAKPPVPRDEHTLAHHVCHNPNIKKNKAHTKAAYVRYLNRCHR